MIASTVMISVGGSNSPAKAAMPPAIPRSRAPNTIERLTMLGPGRTGQEMAERKSLVEFVRRHPAVLLDDGLPGEYQDPSEARQRHPGEGQEQREQARRNGADGWTVRLVISLWGSRCGILGHVRSLERRPARGQACREPIPREPRNGRSKHLLFETFAPYIGSAGSPAMEINGRRNKPFGPGGGTRRLHQSPPVGWP